MTGWLDGGGEERERKALLHSLSAFSDRRNLRIVIWLDIDE